MEVSAACALAADMKRQEIVAREEEKALKNREVVQKHVKGYTGAVSYEDESSIRQLSMLMESMFVQQQELAEALGKTVKRLEAVENNVRRIESRRLNHLLSPSIEYSFTFESLIHSCCSGNNQVFLGLADGNIISFNSKESVSVLTKAHVSEVSFLCASKDKMFSLSNRYYEKSPNQWDYETTVVCWLIADHSLIRSYMFPGNSCGCIRANAENLFLQLWNYKQNCRSIQVWDISKYFQKQVIVEDMLNKFEVNNDYIVTYGDKGINLYDSNCSMICQVEDNVHSLIISDSKVISSVSLCSGGDGVTKIRNIHDLSLLYTLTISGIQCVYNNIGFTFTNYIDLTTGESKSISYPKHRVVVTNEHFVGIDSYEKKLRFWDLSLFHFE